MKEKLTPYLQSVNKFLKQYNSAAKIIITILQAATLIWACIVSFSYLGCLESQLFCPQAELTIPFISRSFNLPTEFPLLIPIIIISSVNITSLFTFPKVHWLNYIAVVTTLLLMLTSLFFITVHTPLQQVLLEEYLQQVAQ